MDLHKLFLFVDDVLLYLGKTGWLFTGVNYNLYQPPAGFCFDILCSDLPVIDNVKSKEYNVDERVKKASDCIFTLGLTTTGMFFAGD